MPRLIVRSKWLLRKQPFPGIGSIRFVQQRWRCLDFLRQNESATLLKLSVKAGVADRKGCARYRKSAVLYRSRRGDKKSSQREWPSLFLSDSKDVVDQVISTLDFNYLADRLHPLSQP